MAAKRVTQDEPVSLRKRFPTKNDLLAWWVHYKICISPLNDLDDPEAIKLWFTEAHRLTDMGMHVELYANCPEFRIEFKSPRDYSDTTDTGRSVGIGRAVG